MDQPDRTAWRVPERWKTLLLILGLIGLVYTFLVSIGLLGASFKLFGKDFAHQLIESSNNPLVALFGGVLATALIQSSSTTTSIVVSLVAAGTMPFQTAIYVVMGANIGTSVTNILVSLGHITRSEEFKRAYSASTIHDFFNLIAVLTLFPLQYYYNVLGFLSEHLAAEYAHIGGLKFASPIKLITKPTIHFMIDLLAKRPWPVLILSLVLLFLALRYLVKILKILVIEKVETVFDTVIFKNAARAMGLGIILTVMVQSSSITTSLVVPLAGAGVLTLEQIFPYTLGANVGTTITAILAALSLGNQTAVAVAFAHLLFNVLGILIVWPIPAIRRIPMRLARGLTSIATSHRWLAVAYILLVFYAVPACVIYFLG